MKLAVSNIAWEPVELSEHLRLLRDLGCDGVELAPSAIWSEPVDASVEERRRLKDLIHRHGLEVVGFHALTYSRPDLQLFAGRAGLENTMVYLKQLARLCGDVGGRILVFGSPKSRKRGNQDLGAAIALAAEGFADVAREAERHEVTICIEPLPPAETDFIRCSEEGMELVSLVGHLNFGLHLDAKAMVEANENFEQVFERYGKEIKHFHVGDSGLAPPGSTGIDHLRIGRALKRSEYDGYVSIEMRRGFGPTREVISKSVDYVRRCYLSGG